MAVKQFTYEGFPNIPKNVNVEKAKLKLFMLEQALFL
jgi:hypothetical protein